MNDGDKSFVWGAFLGVVVGAMLASHGCAKFAMSAAVKHGHAEYYLDEKHDRKFRWLPTPAPKTTDAETHSEN